MKLGLLVVVCCFLQYELFAYNKRSVTRLANRTSGQKIKVDMRDFRSCKDLLQGKDLSHLQLSGANFSPCTGQITKKAVSGFVCPVTTPPTISNLSGANFTGTKLVSVNFSQANLAGAIFSNADVTYADFSGANLTNAVIDSSVVGLDTALFCGAIMPDGTTCSSGSWTSKSTDATNQSITLSCGCSKSSGSTN